jgi:hypothetical protein
MKRLHDRVTEALGSALRRRDPRGFLAIERPFARSIWDVFAVNANEVDPLAVDWDYSATRAGRNYECDEEATNRTEPVQKKVVNFHERATWSFVLAELLKEQQQ